MTRKQISQSVARLCEDTDHKRIAAEDLLLEISNGERKVAVETKCLRAFDSTQTTEQSTATYDAPDNCTHIFSVKIDGRPLTSTDREEMDDYELKHFSSTAHWETEEGVVGKWLYELEEKKIRLIKVPDAANAGKTLKQHYAYMPETIDNIETALVIPIYCEEAVKLYALMNCQRQLETMYKSDHALRQAQIWSQHALRNEQKFWKEIRDIKNLIEGFEGRKLPQRDGAAGLIFEADEY